LLHCETLLVVTSRDFEHVAFVVLAEVLAVDLLAHSLLEERTDFAFIINLNFLLPTGARVSDIELHL
jgi:hypothetical protein